MKKKFFAIIFLPLCIFMYSQTVSAGLYGAGEIRTSEEGFAAEEFRRGVQAFYRSSYNDSILQFEKALSFMPEDSLILEWLGKAYYYSGFEGTALSRWQLAGKNGYGGLLLQNKIEIVSERRIYPQFQNTDVRYIEAGSFPGFVNGVQLFAGPVAVLANNDGTFWVLAYNSNELLLMNVNGAIINRITGPINGFDRPLDMMRLADRKILISETAGDRLSVFSEKGKFIKYIGQKGRSIGQFLGPQYLAQDSRLNIFVSDYGNRRICVFDSEGNPLFHFDGKSENFKGLNGPTGIAVMGDRFFVADDVLGSVYEFDTAGNFVGILVEEKTFKRPEAMKVFNDSLYVCDSNKVYSVDVQTGAVFETATSGNAPSRLTSAVPDVNGNLIVTDIRASEVYVMTKPEALVGGLFIQIQRVNADRFPEIMVDVKIEDRHRMPIVGLKENNFYITEDKRPVSRLKFLGTAAAEKIPDIAIIIDRKKTNSNYEEQVDIAVREIANSMNGLGLLRIISAGNVPAIEYEGNPNGARKFSVKGLKTAYSTEVPMDLALRLASNGLINARKKRSVIVISDGTASESAFDKYNLTQITSYMNNNSIGCIHLNLTQSSCDERLDYIVKNTLGTEYYLFRQQGISDIAADIADFPAGVYTFSYVSALNSGFGQKFLPIEVEAYLLNRSGRDESGYFAPLK